ncbi:ganglioside GM2 activator-like isoform X2 [Periplaneta americana]|uniref:ganglioside GM2 activator-like isoform X2 n=1 Tax=Periplaneta americana TaxID=6978 RepID=UPI0037E74451
MKACLIAWITVTWILNIALGENTMLKKKVQLKTVDFENCGPENDPVKLKNLQVQPLSDGDAKVEALIDVMEDIPAPIRVETVISKLMFKSYVKLPCIQSWGSCTFKDVCHQDQGKCLFPMMEEFNFPCQCPIKKGPIKIHRDKFPVPEIAFASAIVGDYTSTIKAFQGKENRQLACINFNFTLV